MPDQRRDTNEHTNTAAGNSAEARRDGEQPATAGQQATDQASQARRSAIDEAARAGQSARSVGSESAEQVMQSTLTTFFGIAERSRDQLGHVLGVGGQNEDEVTRTTSRNLQAISDSGAVLAQGAQDFSRELVSLAHERLHGNLEGLKRLAGCRSFQELVRVQTELAREGLEQGIAGTRRLAELSLSMAGQAGRTIAAQEADRSAGQPDRHAVELDRDDAGQGRRVA